jgi:quercetin dioxygenase-like cupin family protein
LGGVRGSDRRVLEPSVPGLGPASASLELAGVDLGRIDSSFPGGTIAMFKDERPGEGPARGPRAGERGADMNRKRGAALGAALIAVLLISVNVLPSTAQEPPIATEFLTERAVFTDDVDLKIKTKLDGKATQVVNAKDPSRTVVARFTVQPGAQFPWHTHRGPVVVNVVEGELVYVGAEDCVEREYPAGTAFIDSGHGHVHTAFNPTDDVTVFVATFFEAPEAGSLLIPAEQPAGCPF